MLYRIDDNGDRHPYNVVEAPLQKAKRTTPTPGETTAKPQPDRTTQMFGWLMLVGWTFWSFALGWFAYRWVH